MYDHLYVLVKFMNCEALLHATPVFPNIQYTSNYNIMTFSLLSELMNRTYKQCVNLLCIVVDLGGLGVMCSPRDPRFAGSNPTDVDGVFHDVNILSTSPPGGALGWGSRV